MIRPMQKDDKPRIKEMMRTFYKSPAVSTDGSEEIFDADIEHCLSGNPYLEGYVFADNDDLCGYAMIAKSFSTEFGKHCIWIEDIYIENNYRGRGFGKEFLDFIDKKYPDCIKRLEVEPENVPAVKLYEKCGFTVLPYTEMKKE